MRRVHTDGEGVKLRRKKSAGCLKKNRIKI
jgi:hypothetical protein